MKNKKIALAISALLCSSPAFSSGYLIKITTGNTFDFWKEVGEKEGSWLDDGSIYNCGLYSEFDDNKNAGENYNQTRSCSQDQVRTNIVIEYDPFTDKNQETEVTEERVISVSDTRSVTVTDSGWDDDEIFYNCDSPSKDESKPFSYDDYHVISSCSLDQTTEVYHSVDDVVEHTVPKEQAVLADNQYSVPRDKGSCLTLLDQDSSLGNGNYPLNAGSYYCDMKSGGWTRLTNITTSSSSAGSFTKKSGWNGGSNYPGYGGDELGWWLNQNSMPTSYSDRRVEVSSSGISWKDAKITLEPLYWASVDGFNNTHGYTYNRDSLNGMFVDGLSIFTSNNNLIKSFTSSDSTSRRSQLGISDSQFKAGKGSHTFTYSNGSYTSQSFLLKGMSDQYWKDEEIGFKEFTVFVK